jgi:hypothetical protein
MMTRKEQIAKKAAKAAALATYNAILNPPVWKVAGTSFTTSPTLDDIAKAAAAASYDAVRKLAQVVIKDPLQIKGVPHMPKQPVEWFAVGNVLQRKFPALYDWITAGAVGPLPAPAQVAAKEFANWVKSPIPGKVNWATTDRWPEIVQAIGSNSGNPKLNAYLLSL